MIFSGMAALVLFATPAAQIEPKTPQLTIAVEGGSDAVQQGQRLTYTTTVTNTGAADAKSLDISQTVDPGLTLVSSSPSGKAAGGRVRWTHPLRAGETVTFSVTMDVKRLAPGLKRLAVVSCAARAGAARPLVCATDSAPVTAPAPVAMKTQRSSVPVAWGAGAALLLVLLVLVWRRRAGAR
ncbi:CARDB domain-containing protein [Herbidospora daliensis]|uniref:CARDB domain-containing protein n=1 Tax=Herbidospora daliensis TaxID=295585 RepID=UPI000AC24279|nr:CARDB domain-containing protein [Herbidospora daliensis]